VLCGSVAAKSISLSAFEEIDDVEASYTSLCSDPANTSEECDLLKAQLYLTIVDELMLMERANIEENIEPAIMALRLPDRDVKLHALLVLGNWATRPEVLEATRPYLFDSQPLLAYYAARIQEKSSEPGVVRLAKQFLHNHNGSVFKDLTRLYAVDEHPDYAAHQLPRYANSTPLFLADVHQPDHVAAGFATTDSPDQVVAYYRGVTGQQELTLRQMAEKRAKEQQAQQVDLINHPKLKEIQELSSKYQETLDPALIQRIQEVGKEVEAVFKGGADEGLYTMLPPEPASHPASASGRYFVLKRKTGGQPTEMVVVYFDPVLAKTIIQLAWTQEKSGH
jgi:hypothetical protein